MLLLLLLLLLLFCSFSLVSFRNPVYSILVLILNFIFGSFILFFFCNYFLGIIYIIVYIGALTILFLFVIMMLNIRFIDLDLNFLTYIPVIFFFVISFFFLFYYNIYFNFYFIDKYTNYYFFFNKNIYNIYMLGFFLYNYYFLPFFFCGVSLFVSTLCAVLIVYSKKKLKKFQKEENQYYNNYNKSIKLKFDDKYYININYIYIYMFLNLNINYCNVINILYIFIIFLIIIYIIFLKNYYLSNYIFFKYNIIKFFKYFFYLLIIFIIIYFFGVLNVFAVGDEPEKIEIIKKASNLHNFKILTSIEVFNNIELLNRAIQDTGTLYIQNNEGAFCFTSEEKKSLYATTIANESRLYNLYKGNIPTIKKYLNQSVKIPNHDCECFLFSIKQSFNE